MKRNKTWDKKKRHRLGWDSGKPTSDAWEEKMRNDCAEIIILGGKKKKIRRGTSSQKCPAPTERMALKELVAIAIAKGCPQVVELRGYRVCVQPTE